MAEETYADWTVEELRTEASNRELEGRSGLNKDELVAALEADDAGGAPPDAEVVEGTPDAPPKVKMDAVDKAREKLNQALSDAQEAVEADDRSDPERYQALKAQRERIYDALRGFPDMK